MQMFKIILTLFVYLFFCGSGFSEVLDDKNYNTSEINAASLGEFNSATIQNIIKKKGRDFATIVLAPGAWTISSALTIPANIKLRIFQGAVLTKSGNGTVTINGLIEGLPNQQIFSGFKPGDVTFGRGAVDKVYACWFGAKGDDINFTEGHDSGPAIQAAITAALGAGLEVFLPEGRYNSGITLNMMGPDTFPWPSSLSGAMPAMNWGSYNSSSTSTRGTELYYRGATIAITTGQGRAVTIKNLTIHGPARTAAGSIGIGARGGNSGFYVQDVLINGFETGIKVGYDADGNGDVNRFTRVFTNGVYTGIWFSKSQNYINDIISCSIAARVAIRSDGPSYNVFGGSILPSYVQTNTESIWSTTVSSVSGNNVTFADGSHLQNGMFIFIQGNSYPFNFTTPPFMNVLNTVSSFSANTATLNGYTGGVTAGANVVYGWPSIAYWVTHGADIMGAHIETGPMGDGNWYDPILLYQQGVVKTTIQGIYFNMAAGSNIPYNKLIPLIYANSPVDLIGNMVSKVYPKIQSGAGAYTIRSRDNIWSWEPIFIGPSGYYPAGYSLERMNEKYVLAWGSPNNSPDRGHFMLDRYVGLQPTVAPQRINRVLHNNSMPTQGVAGEFVQATGNGSLNYIGWKQMTDDGNNAELWNTAITATGSITSGSTLLTVSDVSQFWPYMGIEITGAGNGGRNMRARIEFIDGSTNTLYLNTAAGTTVAGASIIANKPTFKTFGRQAAFGSTAPATGAWMRGDIVWNTSPSLGKPIGWVCIAAGTPGTWVPFEILSARQATAPTTSRCGNNPNATGTDQAGSININGSSLTACTLHFSKGWNNIWGCQITPGQSMSSPPNVSSISNSSVTFAFVATTNPVFYYRCDGN